jgi:hypothetical protein
MATDGSRPVSIGTSTVAPNIAMRCWSARWYDLYDRQFRVGWNNGTLSTFVVTPRPMRFDE